MKATDPVLTPSGHTADGGVLVGNADARQRMVVFEDPQCPYCRQFEQINGAFITAALAAGNLAVEYRMRCFWAQSRYGRTMPLLSPPRPVNSTDSARRCLRHSLPRELAVSRPRTFWPSVRR
jgi:Thioredoxin